MAERTADTDQPATPPPERRHRTRGHASRQPAGLGWSVPHVRTRRL